MEGAHQAFQQVETLGLEENEATATCSTLFPTNWKPMILIWRKTKTTVSIT